MQGGQSRDREPTPATDADVAIVGAGFTGAMVAIRLAGADLGPLRVAMFDPRPNVGGGIAYSTPDPDHRLNGPADLITMFGEGHFQRWYDARPADPDDRAPSGFRYARRGVIGDYVNAVFSDVCFRDQQAFRLERFSRQVTDIVPAETGYVLRDDAGGICRASQVFLCIGHEPPRMPGPLAGMADRPEVVRDPWRPGALDGLPAAGDTLVIGSGLTAYDVIATLLRRGHPGRIVAVSRSGRRPQSQGRLDRMRPDFVSPLAPFSQRHAPPYTALRLFRLFRQDLAEVERRGFEWHIALDNLRFSLGDIWRDLPTPEKKRALRHLAGLYETRRFRIAPQTEAIVARAEAAGQVEFRRGRIEDVTPEDGGYRARFRDAGNGHFDIRFAKLVNCTGPNMQVARSASPLVGNLLARGLARPHPTGMGFDVDDLGRPVSADGKVPRSLYLLGPLTNGHFGDMIAMPQIDAKISQILFDVESAMAGAQ